jgi:hypothetical protein
VNHPQRSYLGRPLPVDSMAVVELALQICHRSGGAVSVRLIRRTQATSVVIGTVTMADSVLPIAVAEDLVGQLWRRLLEDLPLVESGQLELFVEPDRAREAPAVPVR